MDRSAAAAVAAHARSMMLVTAVYIGLQPFAAAFHTTCRLRSPHRLLDRPRASLGIIMGSSEPKQASQGPEPSRPEWLVAHDPCAVQGSPPVHSADPDRQCSSMREEGFDPAHITDVLVHEHREDLVVLAQKYGELVDRAEDVETISITDLDGDHMQLDVVYCDQGEQTCVAVAVPIAFPRHCDDGNCIIDVIHELEEMQDVVVAAGGDVELPKKTVSPELMETIARICVVMNRDFQDELVGFVRAYGGKIADKPLGSCEMISLTPDGFEVQAALLPHDPVPISFSKECVSAKDFQKQILEISQQAMMFV